ncbi:MAG: hypothetical protein N2446_01070 [Elusimicrobiales bacterium]|nr:hypothetical protein [Elusimicrobiales bacterium]
MKFYTFKKKKILLIGLFIFSSCSEKVLEQANKLYEENKFNEAISYYEKYLQISKNHIKLEEALYKVGIIYSVFLNNCQKSKKYFETIVKDFPNSKYKEEAYFRAIFCPNYFYPAYKKIILGDSQSFGKNAKEVIIIKNKTFSQIDLISEIYAGKKLLTKINKKYILKNLDFLEKTKNSTQTILKYPIFDKIYKESDGTIVEMQTNKVINTKAGVFKNCIVIKKTPPSSNTSTIYYLAPEIGKILISSLYENKETRIMEIISYE